MLTEHGSEIELTGKTKGSRAEKASASNVILKEEKKIPFRYGTG